MTFDWKAVGVKGYERISGSMFLERMIEGQETREIGSICDQGSPDFESVKICSPGWSFRCRTFLGAANWGRDRVRRFSHLQAV